MLATWFHECCLLFSLFNFLFVHRPIYNMKKEQIDNLFNRVQTVFSDSLNRIGNLVPRYDEKSKQE